MEKSFPASEFPLSVYIMLIVEHACLISLCHVETFWCSSCQNSTALQNWQGGDSVCDKLFQEGIEWVSEFVFIQAETLFTNFLVEHNIALSAVDSAGNLFFYVFFRTAQQLNSMAVAKR